MEVRIGVVYSARELTVDTNESVDAVESAVEAALGGQKLFWLTDTKGRRIGVPSDKIAYVEVAADAGERQVGFGTR
ncbi:MAG TPA: DUF3107 domain-containing protein [Acidimicrobiia bacterium]|nr:DUF3107 domain-containing protein [Acidimicrobiia bacterium]